MSQIAYLLDANISTDVINAIYALEPSIDVRRVGATPGTPPFDTDDYALLEFAYTEKLVIVTFDQNTMPGFAYRRIDNGQQFAGLNVYPNGGNESPGTIADALLLQWSILTAEDMIDRVEYLPY